MKHLKNAIVFSVKNWMLILPLFVLTALASLLSGVAGTAMDLGKLWTILGSLNNIRSPGNVFTTLPGLITAATVGSGIWAFLFQFVTLPTTYGLVNKSLETGNASLNDIGSALSDNFVQYLMYFLGTIVIGLAAGLGSLILILVLSLPAALLKGVGAALMVIFMLALFVVLVILGILISMWFSAMIVDKLDIIASVRKSVEIVKSCFWKVLAITVLVSIATAIAGSILGILGGIPLLGPIIYSAVPTAQSYIMIVFLMSLYREKTGKANMI